MSKRVVGEAVFALDKGLNPAEQKSLLAESQKPNKDHAIAWSESDAAKAVTGVTVENAARTIGAILTAILTLWRLYAGACEIKIASALRCVQVNKKGIASWNGTLAAQYGWGTASTLLRLLGYLSGLDCANTPEKRKALIPVLVDHYSLWATLVGLYDANASKGATHIEMPDIELAQMCEKIAEIPLLKRAELSAQAIVDAIEGTSLETLSKREKSADEKRARAAFAANFANNLTAFLKYCTHDHYVATVAKICNIDTTTANVVMLACKTALYQGERDKRSPGVLLQAIEKSLNGQRAKIDAANAALEQEIDKRLSISA